jgi:hypothetical protein
VTGWGGGGVGEIRLAAMEAALPRPDEQRGRKNTLSKARRC